VNFASRFHRIGDFFHLATGWVSYWLAWLEWRRIYWTIVAEPETGRAAFHWSPLPLPTQHHPGPLPPGAGVFVLLLVIVLVFLRP